MKVFVEAPARGGVSVGDLVEHLDLLLDALADRRPAAGCRTGRHLPALLLLQAVVERAAAARHLVSEKLGK